MESKKLFYLFITVAIGVVLYLTYLVFQPFLTPILLGIIFSIVFNPVYIKLLDYGKGRKALASLSVCILITILIIIPLVYLAAVFTSEVTATYKYLSEAMQSGSNRDLFSFLDNAALQDIYQRVNRSLEAFHIDITAILLGALKEVSSYSMYMMTEVIKNLTLFILDLMLMLFTMYYLFKDSDAIAREVERLIPLTGRQKDRIFTRLKDIIYATLYGSIVAGAAQGVLGGAAFWALGVGSPVIWGTAMGILGVLPILGAFFVWLPASILLLIKGSYIKAILMFLWGSLVISLVDNLIWPLLVSGRAMLHPLLAFFSFLGGILVFGPMGLFAGPFVVALLLILLDIVREVVEANR